MKLVQRKKFAVVILAAGASKRLGQAKQLVKLNGQTLLERAIKLAKAIDNADVFVVTGAYREQVASIIETQQVTELYNTAWQEGMGSSIAYAARCLEKNHQAVLFLTADQYKIKPAQIREMYRVWQANPTQMIAAAYQGRRGIPTLFPQAWFRELKRCYKDVGARHLLKDAGDACLSFDLPEAADDLDTPEDLKTLLSSPAMSD